MKPIIDHIQITVKDLDAAERFYDRFLPIVGFDVNKKVKVYIQEHDFYVVEYSHELLAFALTSPREAFKAEVYSAYEELKKIGANIVAEPKLYPEYSPTYYAVFFKDLENIKYEIVCNK